ncbi:MAG: hypothetical protein ACM3NQ_04595 [Bacteroidales bacterium]
MKRPTKFGMALLSACLVIGGGLAAAQTRAPQPGPLVLQPTNDGPFLAPEVKFASFDGQYGTMVGGYGGWLADNKLLIGAGASFLVDHGHHDSVSGMGYGGGIVGYSVLASKGLHVGVRGLVGFGWADVTDTHTYTMPDYPVFPHPHHDMYIPPPGSTVTEPVYFGGGFFIFEPQASAVVRVARGFALDVAAGYRVISGAGHYNSWLQGPSLSVGVRFGPRI